MLGIAGLAAFAIIYKNNNSGGKPGAEDSSGKGGEGKGKQEEEKKKKSITGITDDAQLKSASYGMLAASLVERIIANEDISKHMEMLKNADPDKLDDELDTDEKRLAFWINVYNGYTQYFLKKDPSGYQSDRNEYFKKEQIYIAGFDVAFNDIEHGVLRRGATIWSKGVVRIPFRNDFVNKFKVDKVDYRIHFALNCGAKSCPKVSVYLPSRTNEQLDKATAAYLKQEAEYDKKEDLLKLPALMTWFSQDFGSREDKRDIAREYKVIPEAADPKIEYKDYDWTMKIENYRQY